VPPLAWWLRSQSFIGFTAWRNYFGIGASGRNTINRLKLTVTRLIMLLVFGDLMKAMWLFLQAVISLARGTIDTLSAFCQFSGFLVQFGTEQSG
jgi:hypothetical protein